MVLFTKTNWWPCRTNWRSITSVRDLILCSIITMPYFFLKVLMGEWQTKLVIFLFFLSLFVCFLCHKSKSLMFLAGALILLFAFSFSISSLVLLLVCASLFLVWLIWLLFVYWFYKHDLIVMALWQYKTSNYINVSFEWDLCIWFFCVRRNRGQGWICHFTFIFIFLIKYSIYQTLKIQNLKLL